MMLCGIERFSAQVPFPDNAGAVACASQGLGKRFLLQGKGSQEPAAPKFCFWAPATGWKPLRKHESCRVLAGQDGSAGGGADGAGGIAVGEANSLGSQSVYIRRLIEFASIAADILPSKVIDKEQYDVGLPFTLGLENVYIDEYQGQQGNCFNNTFLHDGIFNDAAAICVEDLFRIPEYFTSPPHVYMMMHDFALLGTREEPARALRNVGSVRPARPTLDLRNSRRV